MKNEKVSYGLSLLWIFHCGLVWNISTVNIFTIISVHKINVDGGLNDYVYHVSDLA